LCEHESGPSFTGRTRPSRHHLAAIGGVRAAAAEVDCYGQHQAMIATGTDIVNR
jgi:hypothetical protein